MLIIRIPQSYTPFPSFPSIIKTTKPKILCNRLHYRVGWGINKSTGEGIGDASPCYCFIFIFSTFNALAYHNVGICLWHVSLQTVMYQRISNKPKEPSLWFVSLQTVMYQRIGNMPKACPYVMMRFLRYDAIFTNRCKIYVRRFR